MITTQAPPNKFNRINILLEVAAVVFNLLYTLYYLRGDVWCYFFGIIGPILFVLLCYRKKLYAEPLLQVFYIGFAIYGWLTWGGEWRQEHWPFMQHLPYMLSGVLLSALAGHYLKKNTDAKLPYIDSFITVFGIIGMWVMVNYVHENWLYFILINGLSIYVYLRRRMYLGTAMFVLYFIMACDGYFKLGIFT